MQGIDTADIASFIRSLTPVVLIRDTRVTNYGYRNGKATPYQSILQAGSAVLVDSFGVPRAKCSCGNPLSQPKPVQRVRYTGKKWSRFDATKVIVVVVRVKIVRIVLIDVTTGKPFIRPVASDGSSDGTLNADTLCSLFPADPQCATPTQTFGPEKSIVQITSISGVGNHPTAPSVVTFKTDVLITKMMTYHYNNGGSAPGSVALRSSKGKTFGPWKARGASGQGGVANAYWWVYPKMVIPVGTYTVIDSQPSTWSWASDTGGRGIVWIYGRTATTTTPLVTGFQTPESAINAYFQKQGVTYIGDCEKHATPGMNSSSYCSALSDDRGSSRIYIFGPPFSEPDAWLLLQHTAAGWVVSKTAEHNGGLAPPW